MLLNKRELAQVGYEAYARRTGGKTYDGRDMPAWNQLPIRIQDAWTDAAEAIADTSEADRRYCGAV